MPPLVAAEGAWLLRLARAAIAETFQGEGPLEAALASRPESASLAAVRACFVTLEIRDREGRLGLRGCIGSTEPRRILPEAVALAARQAAFEDPRFAPLSAEELPAVVLSVSALTPLVPASSPTGIVPGRDGVVLVAQGRQAVFLPEVAERHGWDAPELLAQLARKAGLPRGAWQRARLFVFTSERFAEGPLGAGRIHGP
ncbi:MAG TPA: AmmeMemoRadiSam system protein A [Candidatus Polarisedimenticolaceae bacterium]|nr:AmmeMemoRadiSam system protein A [Candidatus Polarisedimenticolaceae bacterium]